MKNIIKMNLLKRIPYVTSAFSLFILLNSFFIWIPYHQLISLPEYIWGNAMLYFIFGSIAECLLYIYIQSYARIVWTITTIISILFGEIILGILYTSPTDGSSSIYFQWITVSSIYGSRQIDSKVLAIGFVFLFPWIIGGDITAIVSLLQYLKLVGPMAENAHYTAIGTGYLTAALTYLGERIVINYCKKSKKILEDNLITYYE